MFTGVGGTDTPDIGFDYYRLLWQELNKKFGNTPTKVFVMAVGQQISPFEYRATDGNAQLAAQKTFELVNHTIPCATTYSPNGSLISGLWERLLQEEGPKAGEEHQPAFEEAMHALFGGNDQSKHTKLYQDYLDKKIALNQKKLQIKKECQKEYGDHWESNFNDNLQLSKEYTEFEDVSNLVQPHLDAIEVQKHGPLVHKLKQMEQGTTIILKTCVVCIMHVSFLIFIFKDCHQVSYTLALFHTLTLHGVTQLYVNKLSFMNVYM